MSYAERVTVVPESAAIGGDVSARSVSDIDENDEGHERLGAYRGDGCSASVISDRISNSGDFDHDELGPSRSAASSDSGGTASKLSRMNSLPCGLSMPAIMALLILLPIAFLVAYTAIPLHSALVEERLFTDSKPVIKDLLLACLRMQELRRDAAEYLVAPANSTRASAMQQSLAALHGQVTATYARVQRAAIDSDLEQKHRLEADVVAQRVRLAELLVIVTQRAIAAPAMLRSLRSLIDSGFAMIARISTDSRIKTLEARFIDFLQIYRTQNSVGMMRGAGINFLSRDGFDAANLRALESARDDVVRNTYFLSQASSADEVRRLAVWQSGAAYASFMHLVDDLLSEEPARVAALNESSWVAAGNAAIAAMSVLGVDELLSGSAQHLGDIALEEGLKMLGAVLACVIAAAFVIWVNLREEQKMLAQLRATRVMATAVKKFVPSSQLKMMGVRSITQVHPGLQVEVAQTMLFSDIRDFTGLSEKMTNTELFEWLQTYVERMSKVTSAEHGYVDKFVGDALFCVFPQPTNGVRAAIAMHVSTDQLNLELVAQGKNHMVAIGVGLHFGVVVAGVFGDASRLSCTMVASDVNLASRLEGMTKPFGAKIIASDAVISQIDVTQFCIRCVGKVQVSGSGKAVKIYEIFQSDPFPLKQHKLATLADFDTAVGLCDADPSEATHMLNSIVQAAREAGVVDGAALKKLGGVTQIFGTADGVMAFQKDGSFKSTSTPRPPTRSGSSLGAVNGATPMCTVARDVQLRSPSAVVAHDQVSPFDERSAPLPHRLPVLTRPARTEHGDPAVGDAHAE